MAVRNKGILKIKYYTYDELTSYVEVDTDKRKILKVENYTDDIADQFFAFNISNDWEGFEIMMADRVISPHRPDLDRILDDLEVDGFDIVEIIRATGGRIAGEPYRMEFV